jgi:hypothetical protein
MLDGAHILKIHSALPECHEPRSVEEFKSVIRTKNREISLHKMATCGLGEMGTKRILRLSNIDFPSGYLESVISPDQVILHSPLEEWTHKRSPIVAGASGSDKDAASSSWACGRA